MNAIEVPPSALSREALRALVEEFVTRDGTDYGAVERGLDTKVADVLRQLDRGEVR
ncbi:MAG: YheU family protein, partial [Deltaproteobacteria bacterium]